MKLTCAVNVCGVWGEELGGFDLGKPWSQPIQFRERVTNPFRSHNKFRSTQLNNKQIPCFTINHQ